MQLFIKKILLKTQFPCPDLYNQFLYQEKFMQYVRIHASLHENMKYTQRTITLVSWKTELAAIRVR